jgi:hypothetical protein
MNLIEVSSSLVTKKEIKARAIQDAKEGVGEGNEDLLSVISKVVKMKEYMTSFEAEMRGHLPEGERDGIKVELSNSGDRLSYEDDEVYSSLKSKLKEREALLKTAYKSKGLVLEEDNETIVPKVSIKSHSKEIIKITIK